MSLERQLTAIQKQLAALKTQARKASGKAQRRAKRLERKTRVKLERTVRTPEPKLRAAVAEARLVASARGATVDVREALDRRALRLVTQRGGFCPTGTFRTGEMAAFLERSITDGLADGFPGFVVAEDVAWALGPEARLEEVAGHEELVESLVAMHPVTAICQYAAPHVPPSVRRMALGLHPVVRIPLTDATDVGAVRERGRAVAEPLGFAPGDLTLMWTVISELARNVVERGLRGELILRRLEREHRLGLCVTVRVEEAGLTPTDLLPVLPEVGPLMDECEVLSGADRGVSMSITKWVRDPSSAREARLVLPSWG